MNPEKRANVTLAKAQKLQFRSQTFKQKVVYEDKEQKIFNLPDDLEATSLKRKKIVSPIDVIEDQTKVEEFESD